MAIVYSLYNVRDKLGTHVAERQLIELVETETRFTYITIEKYWSNRRIRPTLAIAGRRMSPNHMLTYAVKCF